MNDMVREMIGDEMANDILHLEEKNKNNDDAVYSLYFHRCLTNNKTYVGITKGRPERRWRSNGDGYKNQVFYRAIKKYGWNNFDHVVVTECLTESEACDYEKRLIAELGSLIDNNGYNVEDGGTINTHSCFHNYKDLTGMKFGRLTVIEFDHITEDRYAVWKCKCDCGNKDYVFVLGRTLLSGHTRSCGCIHIEHARNLTYSHGESNTHLYKIWAHIRTVTSPNYHRRERYYDKGISVCEDWEDYTNFAKWSIANGYDENKSLCRININGDYTPDNCKWLTSAERGRLKRKTVFVDYNGENKTLSEWADSTGLPYTLLYQRYRRGKTGDELFAEKAS